MGTFTGRLDGKGRISIPSTFRDVLRLSSESASLILRPSHRSATVEGYSLATYDEFAAPMQSFDIFSDQEDDLAYALYGDATHCAPDKDGRIILPEAMIAHAHLVETVTFVGLRRKFELWEPAAYAARRAEALGRLKSNNTTLPNRGGAS